MTSFSTLTRTLSCGLSRRHALRSVCLAATVVAGLAPATGAVAQTAGYPNKPVRIIVGFPAGTGPDIVARLLAQKLSEGWGNLGVIVDNKPGAGGSLGANLVARAQPDGYTVLVGNTGSNAINYTAYKKLSYKPGDFVALKDMIYFSNVLVVPAKSPIQTLPDLIAAAKKEPGKLSFSSAGMGQTTHLMGELFKERTGTDVVHVPYKGSAPGTMAIVTGETQFMFDNMTASLAHIKDGKLRPLAVTGDQREPELPDVPTMTELGMKDFNKVGWMGFFVPAKTPPDVVKKLTDNLQAVLHDPDIQKRYRDLGGNPGGKPQADFSKQVADDQKTWGELILSQKLQLD